MARKNRCGAVRVVAIAVLCGASLATAPGTAAAPVVAPSRYPSTRQVQQARSAAAATAEEVRRVQALLVAATARLDAAHLVAEQAAEAFDAAVIRVADLTRAARLAAEAADRAEAQAEQARRTVGQLAAQDYRDGRPSAIDVLFGSQDPQDLVERTATLELVAGGRVVALRRLTDTRALAVAQRAQAEAALSQQLTANAALRLAQGRAAGSADVAVASLAATRAEQQRLLVRLAALHHTSVTLEQQRQAALASTDPPVNAPATDSAPANDNAIAAQHPPAAERQGSGGGSGGGASGNGSGSGSGSGRRTAGPGAGPSAGDAAVAWARGQLGLPYQWGGAGPASYDCSGLTMRAWARAGVQLPHYAASQYTVTQQVSLAAMRPGDLIFYGTSPSDPQSIHHVALYAGAGRMIEAPYTGASVRLVPVRRRGIMPYAGRP